MVPQLFITGDHFIILQMHFKRLYLRTNQPVRAMNESLLGLEERIHAMKGCPHLQPSDDCLPCPLLHPSSNIYCIVTLTIAPTSPLPPLKIRTETFTWDKGVCKIQVLHERQPVVEVH